MSFELHIGGRPIGVQVRRDERFAGMWRVNSGAIVSDMVNLTRAKDASIAWARPRGLGGGETVSWHRRELARGPAPVRQIEEAATRAAEIENAHG